VRTRDREVYSISGDPCSVVGTRQGLIDTLGRAGTGEDQGRTLSRATEESFELVARGANPCFSLRSTDFSAYGLMRL
jgi:hypothetical protein